MKLYHFTVIENLVLISWKGLKPDALGERGTRHAGHPVVWLTRQKSNAAMAADVEHFARPGAPEAVLGAPLFGGPERMTVNLERRDGTPPVTRAQLPRPGHHRVAPGVPRRQTRRRHLFLTTR
jgi:hypothetical protein